MLEDGPPSRPQITEPLNGDLLPFSAPEGRHLGGSFFAQACTPPLRIGIEGRRLLNLTPTQRLAVELKAQGETRAKIAARLGVTKQAVKKLWARARARALADMPESRRRHFVAAARVSAKPKSVRARSLTASSV
jgi:hypothetical protein